MRKLLRIQNLMLFQLLGILISLQAQNPNWVMHQLPGDFPSNYRYAVGETGMIFVDDTSNIVYAFDINDGQWKTYSALSNATWTGALADGNVAMVWSDSLVVAYSALTHSFSPLPNVGYLINGGAVHGCKENFAYVVGPGNWYVFDAEDGQWHIIVRDLQADLEAAQPGVVIVEVNAFLISGSGRMDDIKLKESL